MSYWKACGNGNETFEMMLFCHFLVERPSKKWNDLIISLFDNWKIIWVYFFIIFIIHYEKTIQMYKKYLKPVYDFHRSKEIFTDGLRHLVKPIPKHITLTSWFMFKIMIEKKFVYSNQRQPYNNVLHFN